VGDSGRAKMLAGYLDDPQSLLIVSNRGFTVYTGTYKKVPMSVIATGMGVAMVDFLIRECRAVIDGPMVVIRFGTCGTPQSVVPVGSLMVADTSILIRRNPDHWADEANGLEGNKASSPAPYDISRPVSADQQLSDLLFEQLESGLGSIVVRGMNATADSFYSSQGRIDNTFMDFNDQLLDTVVAKYPEVSSLEMESFQIFHLARCVRVKNIHCAAATIVLAQRKSNQFLDNEKKHVLEGEGGLACLAALLKYPIAPEELMNGPDCYWNKTHGVQELRMLRTDSFK